MENLNIKVNSSIVPFLFHYKAKDEIVAVKFEAELKITNIPWNDSLSNPDSEMFKERKKDFEAEMDKTFCKESNQTAQNMNNSCNCEVTEFTEGSINVIFFIIRIESKQLMPTVADILSSMKEEIVQSGGFIGDYAVNETSVKISEFAVM